MFDVLTRIKILREQRGWSVYKLAKLSGIPQSTIATWYQKNLCPPIDKIEILCNTFGITLTEFFSTGDILDSMTGADELLSKWILLNPSQKNAILTVINTFLISHNQ